MIKKIELIILIIFITINSIFAQFPDTIKIKTKPVKGYGPFPKSLSILQEMSKDNPWIKTIPDIKGIPDNLEFMMFAFEQTDFFQHTYQSYYANKIDEKFYNSCKNSWNWRPSLSEYSRGFVKVDIAVVAGYDSIGLLKIKVDKNNNYDFSDDDYFTLPEKIPGQNFWERYTDLTPFEVSYEYYDGKAIKQARTWFYIDYSPTMYNSKIDKFNPINLVISFPQYHIGEFIVNGEKYFAAVINDKPTFRMNSSIKIWKEGNSTENKNVMSGILKNGFVKIEDYYYRFDKVSVDGGIVTLVKDGSVLEKGGNQIGFKAINFVGKSIDGKEIELSKLKGNYVLLDFWGTWCAPCRDEIPKLKSVYEEFKDKNFVMIGIANDEIEDLNKYIDEHKINWEQIVQHNDKTIISEYGVVGYPTTFLIDPDGIIISKNIRAIELSKKLSKIFKK